MQELEVVEYVQSAARVAGLPLDAGRAHSVATHFARTLAIARLLNNAPLAPEQELAEIYCPAPFPAEDQP